jgi:hypothetical protein
VSWGLPLAQRFGCGGCTRKVRYINWGRGCRKNQARVRSCWQFRYTARRTRSLVSRACGTLPYMEDRKKLGLQAAVLTLLPMALIFPMLAAAHFGPTGPASVWPVLLYAPLAMWMQIRAVGLMFNMYRNGRDPVLIAILPLGFVSLCTYALSGFLIVLALPAFWSSIPLS